MDKLIYLVYPVLLIILFWGAKLAGRNSWNDEWTSLSQMKAIQGFSAICIMLHHCGQKTCAPWLFPMVIRPGLDLFVPIGYFFVGIFFFCSGYGLYKSYKTKPNYLNHFMRRRMLPIILAFYITGIIFMIVRFFMGERFSVSRFIFNITGLQMPNPNSWFVIVLPIFYLGFYLSFKYCKNEKNAVLCTCLVVFLYTLLGTCIDHNDTWWMRGEWWYNSVHFFPLGLLFARHEKTVTEKIKRHYFLYIILTFILIFVFYRLSVSAQNVISYYGEDTHANFKVLRRWVCLFSQMAASCAFVFFVFMAGLKIKIGNKVLAFMGTITMEFYLIHGMFVEFFGYSFLDYRPSLYYIKNVALFVIAVVACSIPSALLIKKLLSLFQPKKAMDIRTKKAS